MFFADANSREKKASAKFVTAKKELSLEGNFEIGSTYLYVKYTVSSRVGNL